MYFLSNLQCTNCTVICDQIGNKSLVLLNASILREYRKNSSLRSACQARRQHSATGGGRGGGRKQILGGTKTSILRIREYGPKHKGLQSRNSTKSGVKPQKKVFISKYARIFTKSVVKTRKKKLLISKNARISTNFEVKPQKKLRKNSSCSRILG